jgi:hypothetical protein
MNFDKLCNSILERAYHGTPHDVVGTFDLNKIGSGEGNQAYGWGLYFAESPKVAQEYRRGLSHHHLINKVKKVYDELDSPEDALELLKSAGLNQKEINLVQALQRDDFLGFDYPHQAVNAVLQEPQNFELSDETKIAITNIGNVYEVDIQADKENDFLDWNKSIDEQSDLIKKAFEDIKNIEATNTSIYKKLLDVHGKEIADSYIPEILKRMDDVGRTSDDGKSMYKDLSNVLGKSEKAASETLLKQGVKGIRYLDQGSRGTGEGTYNYVIFDPKIIQIVAHNGEFVMSSKTPENVEV